MVGMLGKRKRRGELEIVASANLESRSSADDGLQDAFRRAFEAKFKPLDGLASRPTKTEQKIESSAELGLGSDWEGFGSSEDEDKESAVEVIEHGRERKPQNLSRAEERAFMNSKPPSSSSKRRASERHANEEADDGDDDNLNLKNDLALQRLINESHILEKVKDDGTSFGQRQKRMDMRFQALGSKSSILQQDKMPLSHRKGITAKANEREERRRREAKENGIILEKMARPSKSNGEDNRLRGVGGPSVGKFKSGTLRLSKKDVAEIKGPMKKSRGGKTSKRR